MNWLRKNWALLLLMVVIGILFSKINTMQARLNEVEDIAYDASAGSQSALDASSDGDIENRISDLEEKLDDHMDCLELWSIGSGFMNKRDVYFCSSN